jgi:hypothetical protein
MYDIFYFSFRPTEYQTVWRGVSEDLSASYTRGKEFTWWAVSSCTSAISVLESPLYVGTSGPRTIFSIESSSGKSIRGISYFQHEDEILLPPGRYLKVIDKSSPAPNLHIIHLREIQPPHPMLTDPFDLNKLKETLPQPKTVPIPPIVEKKQENNPPPPKNVIPKPVPPPPIVEKKQESNPPTTNAIPKPVPIPPIVEKKQENNPPPPTDVIPKPVPPPPIVENKQESNPPKTNTIPRPVPIPPIVEKKQENNPPTASAVPKPAVEVTAQKGKSILSSPYMRSLLRTTQLPRNETILFYSS